MNEENELEEFAPWLVLIITIIGGALRVLLLAKNGLWLDETFSVWLANHSVAELLHWTASIDQHPPLYYLLLHYWVALNGDAPYYVRLLSAIFGAGAIPIIYLIGKHISGAAVVGVAAAAFLAFSPFNIYFAQETRMYTFLLFNAAVAVYALVRLLTDARSLMPIGSQFRGYLRAWRTSMPLEPETEREFSYRDETLDQTGWRARIFGHRWSPIQTIETDLAWVAFIVFSAVTLLSHNTAPFFILAANIFVLGLMLVRRLGKSGSRTAFQAPSFGNWIKAQIGILLLCSPWIVAFVQQFRRVDQGFWILHPDWETVTGTARHFLSAFAPGQAIQASIPWILGAMFCLALVYFRKRLSVFVFLAVLLAIPLLGELVVSMRQPVFADRVLIWITIPLFLMLAAGIAQLRFRFLIIMVLLVVVTYYLASDGDYYRFVHKEDWSTAAGYVAGFSEKDDLVLFNSNAAVIPFDYYFRSYEDRYAIHVQKQGVPQDLFDSGMLEPKMTESDVPGLVALLSGRKRVWLVNSHHDAADPMGLIPQTLASQMNLLRTRDFYGGQVQLYAAP